MNRLILHTSLWISALPLLLVGCDNNFDCERGDRNLTVEERTVEPFKAISLSNDFDVVVQQGNTLSLSIEAEENIIDDIITKTQDETLVLKKANRSCISPREDVRITITTPELEAVSISGSGNFACDTLSTHYLNVQLSGSGDIRFERLSTPDMDVDISGSGSISLFGFGEQSEMNVSGSGDIFAFGFFHSDCVARISGSGNIQVNVDERLDASISGSGNIIYQGNPALLLQEISGSGSIRSF